MELGFDHQGLARTRFDDADRPIALDWAGLRARFAAAHALRAELAAALFDAPGGSFVSAGSQVLSDERKSFPDVNPTASANRKAADGIHQEVAATPWQATED